ncbi:hypothetical protein [Streptomyces sp. NPDC003036]|uniref:hypothetical protein n=1 Tax=Streptomyces sp. NPDC003036 TaxID=3154442 RepID=UPI0033B2CDD2
MFTSLLRISPEVEAEVQRLMPLLDEAQGWSEEELRWRDERDALLLFAKIAGLPPSDFSEVCLWDRPAARAAFVSGLTGTAIQPMLDDVRGRVAQKFSDTGQTAVRAFASRRGRGSHDFEATSITGQWVIDGGRGSLDAYYYHVDTGTLVVLRYVRPGRDGLFSLETRDCLDVFHRRVHHLSRGIRWSADDYGLLDDPLFLRVHEPEPFTAALYRTSSGAIYPYGQIAAAISAEARNGLQGPSTAALTRHLVPTDFARLVRDGWFGARGVPFETALDWVEATIDTAGVALVVVDFSHRQRGNGSGIKA